MGFYLRKSIRVGPLRFNLSKSGIGVSTGIKGLRFGVGPRGNYVHMGRGGLYYRATLPSHSSTNPPVSPHSSSRLEPEIPPGTHAPLEEIESADVSQLVDSSSQDLLDEMSKKRARMRRWPLVATTTAVIVFIGLSADWPSWLIWFLLLAGIAGTVVAHTKDALAKTVVLFYNFDSEMENAYAQLHSAATQLSGCASAWHIEASGKVRDRKYHAGASDLVRRKNTFIRKSEPPYVKTNIETIAIGVGRQTLHFFPDRVLVYDENGVGAVGYKDLRINIGQTRFIESGSVPKDAQVVDKTWEYVNKSGGPDRRFKNNKALPVCRYEEIVLSSGTGLNELVQVSRCGFGNAFSDAIAQLGNVMPKESSGVLVAANSA